MGASAGPERPFNTGITKDGLIFWVDAVDDKSYVGTGTTWTDLYDRALTVEEINQNFNAQRPRFGI